MILTWHCGGIFSVEVPLEWSLVLVEERKQMQGSPYVVWQLKMLIKNRQLFNLQIKRQIYTWTIKLKLVLLEIKIKYKTKMIMCKLE